MKETIALLIFFWIPPLFIILRNVLWDLYFWQIKEYRPDRFWTHIRWDQEDQNRPYFSIALKFVLFSLVCLLSTQPILALIGVLLTYCLWVNESFVFLEKIISNKFIRPKLKSVRNILIVGLIFLSILVIISIISYPFINIDRTDIANYNLYFDNIKGFNETTEQFLYPDILILLGFSTILALLLDMASPLIVSLFVLLTYPIAKIRRELIISKAKNKLKNHKDITVIAITGSQGKTTTKEILWSLLKEKYNVAKTPENHNTDVGLAMAILSELKSDTQVFIVEMGALRKTEIKNMCKIIKPDISIVTDVDTQHLGIFGSQESLFEAKSEIVRFMKEDGIAILNGDSQYCLRMVKLHSGKNIVYTTDKSIFREYNLLMNKAVLIKDINSSSSVKFVIEAAEKDHHFKVNSNFEHLVDNFSAAIVCANELGIDMAKLEKIISDLDLKLPRLSIQKGDNETMILNDTYSSSRKGFLAAVSALNKIDANRRIILTKGIYELGKHKKTIYNQIAKETKGKFDILITSDKILAQTFLEDNVNIQVHLIEPNMFLYELRKTLRPKDALLLEGRLSPEVIKAIVSEE